MRMRRTRNPTSKKTASSSGIMPLAGLFISRREPIRSWKMLADHLDETPAEPVKEKTNLATPANPKPMGKARAFIRELRSALATNGHATGFGWRWVASPSYWP